MYSQTEGKAFKFDGIVKILIMTDFAKNMMDTKHMSRDYRNTYN